jgi:putative membrane protein
MIISLILGVVLGAILVIFVLQNVAVITVSFLTWQLTGSLALVLLATIISGVVITLLILLPGLIKDDFHLSAVKKQKREVEDELARTKVALADAASRLPGAQTVTIEKTTTVV